MKSIRLATLGIVAAASLFGALAASAAPVTSLDAPRGAASLVTPVGCWWSYGVYHCSGGGGYYKPYRPYYKPYYKRHYRYNY
jgi:hypothetical protein